MCINRRDFVADIEKKEASLIRIHPLPLPEGIILKTTPKNNFISC